MGLSQSLYTGYSGMATHQRSLDNLGNNLANVNTVGFKKSDHLFSSLITKVISGAVPEEDTHGAAGGINVGLGVRTGAISGNFRQGPLEITGNPLDVAINGNGFFLAATSLGVALTRNGSFYLDHTPNPGERLLCVGDGLPVQGWMAENEMITPERAVGNITLPALGDLLPGKATSRLDLTGILPTQTGGSDFAGGETSSLALKGNLAAGENRFSASIFASVSQTGGADASQVEIREIPVEIVFSGPAASADGSLNQYAWTMRTVDWPNPGDPPAIIYPAAPEQGAVSFSAAGSANPPRGSGQIVNPDLRPGSATVTGQTPDPSGGTATLSFRLPGDFTLDLSRLTNLPEAPGGGALEVWSVNGNPGGSLARTVLVYDEYTDFIETADAGGNTVLLPQRRVEARENTLFFSKTGADASGSAWTWRSSIGGAGGTLSFDTAGDLIAASQTPGGIEYNFSGLGSINYSGSLQAAAQDGYLDGNLTNITIDQNGRIFGHYSNNVSDVLAMLALGTVPNLGGLETASGTLFYPGAASGALGIGVAGDADSYFGVPAIGAGFLSSGQLEGSNVALTEEFSTLISTERGYQINSRVVSTSDEMLQTALQLKR
ncbi:MAG: flagellar hook-basal body complex protein [Planctomycetota bacterium]|jgi:flagellar hook protein FlgE|nr:flagellar hook-basal body complex protein [Planctomycetota bacterium]